MMKILISGIASDIGFGAGRILRNSDMHVDLHGIDVHENHPGKFIFDEYTIAPRATEMNYISWIESYIERKKIDCFIPTSEPEILKISELNLFSIKNAKILISNKKTVQFSLDKHECLNFLEKNNVQVPRHGLVGVDDPIDYPIIVKPRAGQGSKGIHKVCNKEFLDIKGYAGYVWQDFLSTEDNEYTCAIFKSKRVGTRILILKRWLQGGLTGRAIVVNDPIIESYVNSIANIYNLDGVMNIQIRLTKNGPYLFEINPRLSSTLVFRDAIGFSDLKWWLLDKFEMQQLPFQKPKKGIEFYRGAKEYINFN